MPDKRKKYLELVTARKQCALCEGLENPSRCAGGIFDSDEIGVWTTWQANLDAMVMIVGQDWGGTRNFQLQQGRDIESETIRMLCELLALAGIQASPPTGQTLRGELFCTNAVLCLKSQGDQGKLHPKWAQNCRSKFLRPQIEIVQPELVICMGQTAYEAVLGAYGLSLERFRDAVDRKVPRELAAGIRLFAVYHCGRRIRNTHRSAEAQRRDWKRIGDVVARLRDARSGETRS